MTPLQEAAVMMHELFTSLIEAGFTPEQALYLTGENMKGPGA